MTDRQHELIGELRRRFPLIERIVGRFGEDTPQEPIPCFFGLLMAAALKPGKGPCCFVLDKTPGTAPVAAILTALVELRNNLPGLVNTYINSLLRGQRVKVLPDGFVYEYEGPWIDYPGQFRLRFLHRDAWRSFSMEEVLRLEPTEHLRPRGDGDELAASESDPFDNLLDYKIFGNSSIIQNTVLVYMPRSRFWRVAESIALGPGIHQPLPQLSSFLPWGFIGRDGTLKSSDQHQVVGEPLVASTVVAEDLAMACLVAEPATKVVYVDGANGLARNLQAFDDIAESQRVLILASPDENVEIDLLRERGCPIWYMSGAEVLLGEASDFVRTRSSFIGATLRAADVRKRIEVHRVDCNDEMLQSSAQSLERASELLVNMEEASEAEEILRRLFRILFECSECCFGLGEEFASELEAIRGLMALHKKWLDPPVARELQEAIEGLERASQDGSGKEKADAFLELLTQPDRRLAVAARSPRTAEWLRGALNSSGADAPVLPVSGISVRDEFDGIIVPAWPNDRNFTRLKNMAVTGNLFVLTYPFESKWVTRHQARERARLRANRMETGMRSEILDMDPSLVAALEEPEVPMDDQSETKALPESPVFLWHERFARRHAGRPPTAQDGEDGREARFVRFAGGCHAMLTEWAELPLLNELIGGARGARARIKPVIVSELSPGDFVLFRDSGDKEFIRLIAEEEVLGAKEYSRIRAVAERWKAALLRLGDTPAAIQKCLEAQGLKRSVMTVAGWLHNPDHIGPRGDSEVGAIAEAAEDLTLLSVSDEVTEAIRQIRSAHQTAGRLLTKLILGELDGKLDEPGERPEALDLDYGHAWVVQVDSVDANPREYPTSQVNRLRWNAESLL